jgi:hypothetical protein
MKRTHPPQCWGPKGNYVESKIGFRQPRCSICDRSTSNINEILDTQGQVLWRAKQPTSGYLQPDICDSYPPITQERTSRNANDKAQKASPEAGGSAIRHQTLHV